MRKFILILLALSVCGVCLADLDTMDGSAFTYADAVIENTSVATGTVDADVLFLRGTGVSGTTCWYDDVTVGEGGPEWPDS